MARWPASRDELQRVQLAIADESPEPWSPSGTADAVGGVFAAFPSGIEGNGAAGDPVWAAAVVIRERRVVARAVVAGETGAPYEPGLLALREGPALEAAVRALSVPPDVLLVNATGRDHPRGAGLALQLGRVLGVPTIGVTDRPLVGEGRGVAFEIEERPGLRPIAVHAAWRTDVRTAVDVVRSATTTARTPEPLREARRLARIARASSEGRLPTRRERSG